MESETRYSLLEMAHESSVSAEEAFRIGDFENARKHYEIASEKFESALNQYVRSHIY